jgi:uncharacterized membrane protein YhaH (DUF805 family)
MQAAIAALLIMLVGTQSGRNGFDATLRAIGLNGLPWDQFDGGFETLVSGSAPVYWSLCLLTAAAVFVLRWKDRSVPRPFTVPLYPIPALLFLATCVYMLQASLAYAKWLSLIGFVPLALGGLAWLAAGGRFIGRTNHSSR